MNNMILFAIMGVSAVLIIAGIVAYQFVNQVYAQENGNEVTVTIVQGSADAGSGENKYSGQAHAGIKLLPLDSKPFGLTYSQWLEQYFKWTASIPEDENHPNV
jgi:hypothetical protein